MTQQTAVEWLFSQIPFEWSSSRAAFEAYQQAKEMDKQQIKDAYEHGQNNGCSYEYGAEEYYKETYKTQNT